MLEIQLEPWGGIAIIFPHLNIALLVDPFTRECWTVLHGRPLWRRPIAQC